MREVGHDVELVADAAGRVTALRIGSLEPQRQLRRARAVWSAN